MGIVGASVVTRPDIEELITRALLAVVAMLVTFGLTELLQRANSDEVKEAARRRAKHKRLESKYEFNPERRRTFHDED